MSTAVETISEVKTDLLHASISLKKEENERNQKEDSARMLKARRAIESYLEEKRLSKAISDGWDE
ncbi:PA3496 family putative envelope integrity protein [Rhodanobacter aciditrophus]|uniref:PA3496 family putative envelope integrity protein n=1 Tax=Rhodanobacter aciditrophus TaxID=1623218 RepID=A0ABW4AYP5_9GAMM